MEHLAALVAHRAAANDVHGSNAASTPAATSPQDVDVDVGGCGDGGGAATPRPDDAGHGDRINAVRWRGRSRLLVLGTIIGDDRLASARPAATAHQLRGNGVASREFAQSVGRASQ